MNFTIKSCIHKLYKILMKNRSFPEKPQQSLWHGWGFLAANFM
ncbi:hypothetical protein GFS31_01180 [Leptolyngbya sp. BL0902]|nr:hypothetical protein GFS31_01180 [Leptolyngbya sp. BL0902]